MNAVVHRDYNSNASVEVRLFTDRLEVWNPGTLPGTLTLESLQVDHPSVPFNPLLAEALYLVRYIEKAGSGTQRIIELCVQSGLPTPTFEVRNGSFVLTLWRDWLTAGVLTELNVGERERKALLFLKNNGTITNSQYQLEFSVSKRTATLGLSRLLKEGLIVRQGSTGKGVRYSLDKGAPKGQWQLNHEWQAKGFSDNGLGVGTEPPE